MNQSEAPSLQVFVNDEPRSVAGGSTVADLVAMLGLQPAQVAVECNQQLVRRAEHDQVVLQDGDRLEVVTFFGGG